MSDSPANQSPLAWGAGMLIGALMGFALWIATDTFALFPAFLGVGAGLAIAFQSALDRRRE